MLIRIHFLFLVTIPLFGFCQELRFENRDGVYTIGTQANRTASISLCDVDQDGYLDALVANGRHWPEQNYVFYNDKSGLFRMGQSIGRFLDSSYAMKGADFNQDGFMDLVVGNDMTESKLYFGQGNKSFSKGIPVGVIARTRNVEVIDIDNDGDIDIIFSNRKEKNEIFLNDGTGMFVSSIQFGLDSDQTIQSYVIDVNGDQHLDILTAERGSKNKIYLNDGQLNFSLGSEFGDIQDGTRSIALADLNMDGNYDIVAGNLKAGNKIFYGNGKGSFDLHYTFEQTRTTSTIHITDFNQDGYLDILEGNFEDRNYVHMGSASGSYQEIGLRKDLADDTYNVTTGDLNMDSLPDIIISNSGDWNLFYKTILEKE